jgi:hypothetical protein
LDVRVPVPTTPGLLLERRVTAMPDPRDTCRPVALPSGEQIVVRGGREMDEQESAMLEQVVGAARRLHELTHPVEQGVAELWARIEAALRPGRHPLRDAAQQVGVRFAVLFRVAQGRMPGEQDRAAIEAWLAPQESPPP